MAQQRRLAATPYCSQATVPAPLSLSLPPRPLNRTQCCPLALAFLLWGPCPLWIRHQPLCPRWPPRWPPLGKMLARRLVCPWDQRWLRDCLEASVDWLSLLLCISGTRYVWTQCRKVVGGNIQQQHHHHHQQQQQQQQHCQHCQHRVVGALTYTQSWDWLIQPRAAASAGAASAGAAAGAVARSRRQSLLLLEAAPAASSKTLGHLVPDKAHGASNWTIPQTSSCPTSTTTNGAWA